MKPQRLNDEERRQWVLKGISALGKTLHFCPQCGHEMRVNIAKKPLRALISCAACKTYVADDGTIKTSVGQ